MTTSIVTRKRTLQCGTKVKTGCTTCRIRKVKCDEEKPSCLKCVNTGRICDGYQSQFKSYIGQPPRPGSDVAASPNRPRPSDEITLDDIALLNRYFSTKTIFNVDLGCNKEARQVLQASRTDASVRHAVSALRALREHLDGPLEFRSSNSPQITEYDYGLQQYSMALKGLASNVASSGFEELKSALLCCQIFISIEQVQENYASMAKHMIGGLGIMRECRARPDFAALCQDQLPLMDIFIIKIFSAPCKFADSIAVASTPEGDSATPSTPGMVIAASGQRMIAPDMRTELTRIAASTLKFLDSTSNGQSLFEIFKLRAEKTALLKALKLWHARLGHPGPEPLSISFMRLFYFTLRIVLLGVLESSTDGFSEMRMESEALQHVADDIGRRLQLLRNP